MELLAAVAGEMLRGRSINSHATDRIGRGNIVPRCGHELLAAALRAEVVRVPVVNVGRLAGRWIDLHAADRIPDPVRLRSDV